MVAFYISAGAAGLIGGLPTFLGNRLRWWWTYVQSKRLIITLVAVQCLVYVGAGLLSAAGVGQWKRNIVTGILAGFIPHGLTRVPFPYAPVQDLRDPQTPLGRLLSSLSGWLDSRAKETIRPRVHALELSRLKDIAWDLVNEMRLDAAVPRPLREQQEKLLNEADTSPQPADMRGRYRGFVLSELVRTYRVDVV
jgi:hypothetical protein